MMMLLIKAVMHETLQDELKSKITIFIKKNIKTCAFYFSEFSIEDETDYYRLHIDGYSGTAGDGMLEHPLEGMLFSTMDRDNDLR